MHLAHHGLSMVNTKNNKKKPTAAQLRAKAEHEAWLRKNGVHPEQLQSRPKNTEKVKINIAVDNSGPQVSNGFANAGMKKTIWDSQWQRIYEDDPVMAEREAEALRKADEKRQQTAPLYSKGPYQYITKDSDTKTLGRKI